MNFPTVSSFPPQIKRCDILEPHSPHTWIEQIAVPIPDTFHFSLRRCVPSEGPISKNHIDRLILKAMTLDNWDRHLKGPEGGVGNKDSDEPGPTLFAQVVIELAKARIKERLTRDLILDEITHLRVKGIANIKPQELAEAFKNIESYTVNRGRLREDSTPW